MEEFWFACRDGKVEIARRLLQNEQINPNLPHLGWTPLYGACYKGRTEIVKLLLNDKRISIRKKNYQGKTAIDDASSSIVKIIKEFDTGNHC